MLGIATLIAGVAGSGPFNPNPDAFLPDNTDIVSVTGLLGELLQGLNVNITGIDIEAQVEENEVVIGAAIANNIIGFVAQRLNILLKLSVSVAECSLGDASSATCPLRFSSPRRRSPFHGPRRLTATRDARIKLLCALAAKATRPAATASRKTAAIAFVVRGTPTCCVVSERK
jgi:hypothetical protein